MSVKKFFAVVGALFIAGFILWTVRGTDPHNFEGKCTTCHVGLKDPTILKRDPNHLCLSCHPNSANRSHPSGMVPAKPLPAKYPLYKGKMVCITCHFPHRSYAAEASAAVPGAGEQPGALPLGAENRPAVMGNEIAMGPYLLRAEEAGKIFCYSCHQGTFVSEKVDSHAITFQTAHTKALDYSRRELVDDNSRECLSCHDGTLSSMADTHIKGLSWEHSKNIGLSHPIGVDYESVYLRNSRRYHPPRNLDPRILLLNGKIGCATCHSHYSKNRKRLVMSNIKSRLCLSCHNL